MKFRIRIYYKKSSLISDEVWEGVSSKNIALEIDKIIEELKRKFNYENLSYIMDIIPIFPNFIEECGISGM